MLLARHRPLVFIPVWLALVFFPFGFVSGLDLGLEIFGWQQPFWSKVKPVIFNFLFFSLMPIYIVGNFLVFEIFIAFLRAFFWAGPIAFERRILATALGMLAEKTLPQ